MGGDDRLMAYTSVQSGEIPEGAQYYSGKLPLGDYNFYLQFDASTGTVVTRCDLPSGIRAATQRTLPDGANLTQWRVEANETEASVYATISEPSRIIKPGGLPIITAAGQYIGRAGDRSFTKDNNGSAYGMFDVVGTCGPELLSTVASAVEYSPEGTAAVAGTYQGITWYLSYGYHDYGGYDTAGLPAVGEGGPWSSNSAFTSFMEQYGLGVEMDITSKLVARFQININDAGGYPGGNGDWISPGDWNQDPTTTLHLTVNGALSGRHNDPLADPGYSYLPADNTAQAGYGCGGAGGHGGGGGGGASTVIVRQFATNKANSKDIIALAKRHGYGSGGGKGGKGGDGCILIYY